LENFWNDAFIEKKRMWGDDPTVSAKETAKDFEQEKFKSILIPGIGYGRNAVPFLKLGLRVTGIEVSETAIKLAKERFGQDLKIFCGSVDRMPFDDSRYDGVYCHALVHLLDFKGRKKFLRNCFDQLRENGKMVFTTISKSASTYGVGPGKEKDRYLTKDGLEIFFTMRTP
jgi:SAM-dependent methyltransferase